MQRIWALLTVGMTCVSCCEAHALDSCDQLTGPKELLEFISSRGVDEAPIQYWKQAQAIQIDTGDVSGGLIPHATFDPATIAYPSAFPAVLCRMVLATYVVLGQENYTQAFAAAAREAAKCAEGRGSIEGCLLEYSRDLERRYLPNYQALVAQNQTHQIVATEIFENALGQIAKHEYAHHLLRHRERIRSGAISRIDAEFEADFYALQNDVANGRSIAAMYYFFSPLAQVESYTKTRGSADYESADCRSDNARVITKLFYIAPDAILDTVKGGGRHFRIPVDLRKLGAELASNGAPRPSVDCGRLAPAILEKAHHELLGLIALIDNYSELLRKTSKSEKRTELLPSLNPEDPQVLALINDLEKMSEGVTELRGLVARVLMFTLYRTALSSTQSESFDRLLRRALVISRNDILAEDYGVLLQEDGVRALLIRTRRPFSERLDEAEPLLRRAVTISPKLSKSWINLAMIASGRGNCDEAAELANKAAATAAGDDQRRSAESLREIFRGISDSRRCAQLASKALASKSP